MTLRQTQDLTRTSLSVPPKTRVMPQCQRGCAHKTPSRPQLLQLHSQLRGHDSGGASLEARSGKKSFHLPPRLHHLLKGTTNHLQLPPLEQAPVYLQPLYPRHVDSTWTTAACAASASNPSLSMSLLQVQLLPLLREHLWQVHHRRRSPQNLAAESTLRKSRVGVVVRVLICVRPIS